MAKETTGDTIVRYTITIGASILIMAIITIGVTIISGIDLVSILIRWLILPIITYGISFGFNALLQYIQCDTVHAGLISKISTITPLAVIAAMCIVKYIPFLLYPIRAAMVGFSDSAIQMASTAFTVFWASYYAQIMEASFTAVCNST